MKSHEWKTTGGVTIAVTCDGGVVRMTRIYDTGVRADLTTSEAMLALYGRSKELEEIDSKSQANRRMAAIERSVEGVAERLLMATEHLEGLQATDGRHDCRATDSRSRRSGCGRSFVGMMSASRCLLIMYKDPLPQPLRSAGSQLPQLR